MKIYVAGAGAMGCRFGVQLAEAGQDVVLLDKWDEHIEAIRSNGLKVSGDEEKTVELPIMRPEEAEGTADLIVLFTKAMQLPDMLDSIAHLVGPETQLLCTLNGLGHQDVIAKHLPDAHLIMAVTVWTAQLEGPGHVRLESTGTINIQNLEPDQEEAGRKVAAVLSDAGLGAIYDEDVFPSIWRKAAVNGTMNSTCALLDCTVGEMFNSDNGLEVVHAIIAEFVEVGRAEGIALDKDKVTDYVMETSKSAAHHYPSMHQDLVQNKRRTEIDFINGAVSRLGRKHGIATPNCDLVTRLVHAKEDILLG